MKRKELIAEAVSLPVEERAIIADLLLRSLNQPDTEIDKKWLTEAQRRLYELKSGSTQPVPGREVFDRIRNKFEAYN